MTMKIDNFTAVLPVTCNADCGFCPEKEMPDELKAHKDDFVSALIRSLKTTAGLGFDHVSLTGGEPTLDSRLLSRVINAVINETPIKKVGMTTNGQFMESEVKLNKFFDAITDDDGMVLLDFINISRHAVRTEENNSIMGVNYSHSMRDLISMRKLIPQHVSFHINVVVQKHRDLLKMFSEFKAIAPLLEANHIDVVFRTDYEWLEELEDGIIPDELETEFNKHFGSTITISECPTCLTLRSVAYSNMYLKGATFEPTDHEETYREVIFHQDGNLYFDWKREKPYKTEEQLELENLDWLLGEQTIIHHAAKLIVTPPPRISLAEEAMKLHPRPAKTKSLGDIPVAYVDTSCGYLPINPCEFRAREVKVVRDEYQSCGYGRSGCGY